MILPITTCGLSTTAAHCHLHTLSPTPRDGLVARIIESFKPSLLHAKPSRIVHPQQVSPSHRGPKEQVPHRQVPNQLHPCLAQITARAKARALKFPIRKFSHSHSLLNLAAYTCNN
ncbi:hypothetical protein AOQ84DRAFT_181216 [Glonium stellatum]|uniref:Uncharacterized protein n=1 Tax=Glonium stellatum TaxID=574774 RepID=A0A8E2EPF6_9PEZI|nr:hypothetical protein AOQ84DRAFT_181216 [Glonium stellatum]